MLMMFVCKKVFVVGQKIRGKKKKRAAQNRESGLLEQDLGLVNNAKILSIGFGVKSKYMEQYKANALNDTFSKISELTIDQKKWFAIALHAMLYEIGIKPSFRHIQYYLTLGQQTSNPYIK